MSKLIISDMHTCNHNGKYCITSGTLEVIYKAFFVAGNILVQCIFALCSMAS